LGAFLAKSKEIEIEKNSLGIGKILFIIIAVFITIPIIIMSIVYYTNDNFKFVANKYLGQVSGPIGKYFESFSTKEEKEVKKRTVAKYLISLDVESASDKLTIIKNEDEKLYSDLIKICTQLNSNQTKKILEYRREGAVKKDILTSIIEQIKNDQIKGLQEKAKYYESTSLVNAVKEIGTNLMNETVSYSTMGLTIEQMKEGNVADILECLDDETKNKLLANYQSTEKRKKITKLLNQMNDRKKELTNIANIYNSEKADKLVADIGNDQKYKMNELSMIYRNMNMLKAAKVLAKVQDKNFTYNLLEQIKNDEMLTKDNDLLTEDLMNAMKVYREYDKE
jgi:Fe2+ or Zn2+ uptake regulation protein